jgi:transcriptional regulator with XRE-family HTH domain
MSFDRLSKKDRAAMGRRLKAARQMSGKTIRGVAEELGAHVASITQWEAGSVPVAATRARLAELYGIDEKILFAEIEAKRQAAVELLTQSPA